jgi:hypothetical protein
MTKKVEVEKGIEKTVVMKIVITCGYYFLNFDTGKTINHVILKTNISATRMMAKWMKA